MLKSRMEEDMEPLLTFFFLKGKLWYYIYGKDKKKRKIVQGVLQKSISRKHPM